MRNLPNWSALRWVLRSAPKFMLRPNTSTSKRATNRSPRHGTWSKIRQKTVERVPQPTFELQGQENLYTVGSAEPASRRAANNTFAGSLGERNLGQTMVATWRDWPSLNRANVKLHARTTTDCRVGDKSVCSRNRWKRGSQNDSWTSTRAMRRRGSRASPYSLRTIPVMPLTIQRPWKVHRHATEFKSSCRVLP